MCTNLSGSNNSIAEVKVLLKVIRVLLKVTKNFSVAVCVISMLVLYFLTLSLPVLCLRNIRIFAEGLLMLPFYEEHQAR